MLEIECDNAAFGDNYAELCFEAARILREAAKTVADDVIEPGGRRKLFDVNGNSVGFIQMPEREG
jgi:hypothetical protein